VFKAGCRGPPYLAVWWGLSSGWPTDRGGLCTPPRATRPCASRARVPYAAVRVRDAEGAAAAAAALHGRRKLRLLRGGGRTPRVATPLRPGSSALRTLHAPPPLRRRVFVTRALGLQASTGGRACSASARRHPGRPPHPSAHRRRRQGPPPVTCAQCPEARFKAHMEEGGPRRRAARRDGLRGPPRGARAVLWGPLSRAPARSSSAAAPCAAAAASCGSQGLRAGRARPLMDPPDPSRTTCSGAP